MLTIAWLVLEIFSVFKLSNQRHLSVKCSCDSDKHNAIFAGNELEAEKSDYDDGSGELSVIKKTIGRWWPWGGNQAGSNDFKKKEKKRKEAQISVLCYACNIWVLQMSLWSDCVFETISIQWRIKVRWQKLMLNRFFFGNRRENEVLKPLILKVGVSIEIILLLNNET